MCAQSYRKLRYRARPRSLSPGMSRISLLAGLLLILCVSQAAADEVLDCQPDFTYPRSSYPIRAGKFKEVVKVGYSARVEGIKISGLPLLPRRRRHLRLPLSRATPTHRNPHHVPPLGQPRTQGNFINRAFDVAVKTATIRMKEEGLIRLTCKPTWTKKVYGCFNVSCSCKGLGFRRLCVCCLVLCPTNARYQALATPSALCTAALQSVKPGTMGKQITGMYGERQVQGHWQTAAQCFTVCIPGLHTGRLRTLLCC